MEKSKRNKRIDFFIDLLMGMKQGADTQDKIFKGAHGNSNNGWVGESVNPTKSIKRTFEPSTPFMPWYGVGIDTEAEERLFYRDGSLLASDIRELIGDGFELAFLHGLSVKWFKVVPADIKRLKGFSVIKHDAVFELHYRLRLSSGEGEYVKRVFAIYNNKPVPVFYNGQPTPNDLPGQIYMLCSTAEDFYRKGVYHAKITNLDTRRGVTLAIDGEALIDLMKFRDTPRTESGRKRPILHWVKEYLKKGVAPRPNKVSSHHRGIEVFEEGGVRVEITPPRKTFDEMQYRG